MAFMRKSILKTMLSEDAGSDRRIKVITDRINLVDKHIPELKTRLTDYTKRIADGEKSVEKISRILNNFTANEPLEMTLKSALKAFAVTLQDIVTNQEDFVGELNGISSELDVLTRRCKHLKEDIKNASCAAGRQQGRERQVKRLDALADCDPTKQSSAQAELIKARSEHSRAKSILEEHADIFEQEKVQTVRDTLLAWATAELRYHAKALELFTKAFRTAQMIDIQQDLAEYRCRAKSTAKSARLLTVRDTTCPYESEQFEFVTSTPRVQNQIGLT